jgi:pimeloyl-ACP methyl ester carboxylesterase
MIRTELLDAHASRVCHNELVPINLNGSAMELVRVTTSDGLWLDGTFSLPESPPLSPLPIDVFILVHGTASNFYAPGVLETFARQANLAGLAVLRINTRGHDGISSIPGERKAVRGGATYEHVAECRLDLRAWIEFLQDRGYSRIGLCGHSMGGVKSAFTLAHDSYESVKALTLISSPRFHHQTMLEHPAAVAFRSDFEDACYHVLERRPDELIEVTQPMPFVATAAGFLDKYGPNDHYDLARLLPLVRCPVLYVLGTHSPEQSIGFAGLPATLTSLSQQHQHICVSFVEGANTNYSGMAHIPFERTWTWLMERQASSEQI